MFQHVINHPNRIFVSSVVLLIVDIIIVACSCTHISQDRTLVRCQAYILMEAVTQYSNQFEIVVYVFSLPAFTCKLYSLQTLVYRFQRLSLLLYEYE